MKRIGIIGSGDMGSGIARLAVAAGYEVLIANSRGPAALQGLIDELGPQTRAGDVREAADFGEIPVLAMPLGAYPTMPEGALAGKTILSTANYSPGSDGRVLQLDALELTTAELEQGLLPGTVVVKAFSNIFSHHIPAPAASGPRTALAIFGDDEKARPISRPSSTSSASNPSTQALWPSLGVPNPNQGRTPRSTRPTSRPSLGITSPHWVRAPVTGDQLRQLVAGSQRADVAALEF